MTGSSPAPRRSHQWSSPQRTQVLADLLNDDRNSETRHRHLLETAKKEHDRVREEAERVIIQHQKKEERQRLLEEKRKEENRIQLEEQIAAERLKLLALKEKKVEIPPAPPAQPQPEPAKQQPPANLALGGPTPPPAQQLSTTQPNGQAAQTPASAPPKPNPFVQVQPQPPLKPAVASPFAGANPANGTTPVQLTTTPTATPAAAPSAATVQAPPPSAQPTVDRYTVIHRNLKALRQSMKEQIKHNQALKARMGDMRREIVKSIGQLTNAGAGANQQQQERIRANMQEALENRMGCVLVDPGMFTFEPREPVQGAAHNEPQLPSLFFYLINIFAKGVIQQFIVEAGANPETADPIGVVVAIVFSDANLHWRGASFIDILMAKFRIVCPVLFGYRGNEKTEQGRAKLGWWKDNGHWIGEQAHMTRMMGLGSGFAAVALRNFGKSARVNPYPPRHYWVAMAKIVNTPSAEISNTQCLVLKAMIVNYEQKFIEFYGTAALAAMRTALIEFPARAPEKSAAVNSLEVVATLLRKDTGLVLG
ncbi:GLE1-like protein-domain-containing protein [Cercophora newfieldiana]|uniref:mRNA export factor GLE1 n=1 Tax=Cercophora newfieldiana TaxID=92897 RepID=A0AA39YGR7_9PEZI|nr:GLE1-like protein-domain-containing protein [Cercophora newfieldiana]